MTIDSSPKKDQKMITPSAKASVMQPRYKLRLAKLKKGKGSYNRKEQKDGNVWLRGL